MNKKGPIITAKDVSKVLGRVMDPELGINVVDLGFIYEVKVIQGRVKIKMTLTCAACPMQQIIAENVKREVCLLPGVRKVEINLVFDPPWSVKMISRKAKRQLGLK